MPRNVSAYSTCSRSVWVLTGKGHATDFALMQGLSGSDPEYIPVEAIHQLIEQIRTGKKLALKGTEGIHFEPHKDIVFEKSFLPFHSNGLTFEAGLNGGDWL